MVSRALRILVISEDRQHLRDCYDFFVACGYEVETQSAGGSCSPEIANRPDVIIYDFVSGQTTTGEAAPFRIAVIDVEQAEAVRQAIAEGTDDIVLRPITPAKLLVRIRAAASSLEARAAILREFGRAPRSSYPGEGAFRGTLQYRIEQLPQEQHCLCAALFSVGATNAGAYRQWLQDLEASALPDSQMFELPRNRIAVITPSVLPEQMSHWVRERISATPSVNDTTQADQPTLQLSASIVSTRDEGATSEQLSLLLTDRLNLALSLGQGLVIDETEENVWLPSHPEGSIFDGMIAEDIMRPTTVTLCETDTVQSAIEKLKRWNADIAPVCSAEGQPRGLVRVEELLECQTPLETVSRHCLPNVPQVSHDAPFEEFVALFSSHDSAWLQVIRENQPAGVVHCDDLTSMNSPVMVSLA